MKRTSILVGERTYDTFADRARRRGTTVSEEMRRVLDSDASSTDEGHLDPRFIELCGMVEGPLPGPSIDSDEFKEEMANAVFGDAG